MNEWSIHKVPADCKQEFRRQLAFGNNFLAWLDRHRQKLPIQLQSKTMRKYAARRMADGLKVCAETIFRLQAV